MTTSSDKAECITEFSRSLKGCSVRSTTLSSSYMLLKRMACCTSSIFFGFVWIFPECYSPEVFSSGPHISSAYPTCMQRVKNSEDTDLRHPIGRGQHSVAYSLLPEVGNSLAPKASFNDAHRAQVLKIEIRILCKVGNVPSFPCARLVMYPPFLRLRLSWLYAGFAPMALPIGRLAGRTSLSTRTSATGLVLHILWCGMPEF